METQELVSLEIFCRQHDVPSSFMISLQDFGLIHIIEVDQVAHIEFAELNEAEKLLRLHHDLDINLEGIDAIIYLLQKIKNMQSEMQVLKSRLALYEAF